MPKASVKRLIECKKEQLIDQVLDIEKYPKFVPFCVDAKVYEKKEKGNLLLIVASSPLTRSSYHADEDFSAMKKLREKQSQCHQLQ